MEGDKKRTKISIIALESKCCKARELPLPELYKLAKKVFLKLENKPNIREETVDRLKWFLRREGVYAEEDDDGIFVLTDVLESSSVELKNLPQLVCSVLQEKEDSEELECVPTTFAKLDPKIRKEIIEDIFWWLYHDNDETEGHITLNGEKVVEMVRRANVEARKRPDWDEEIYATCFIKHPEMELLIQYGWNDFAPEGWRGENVAKAAVWLRD